jgi:hypothetical protein
MGFAQRKENHVRELFESRARAEDEAAAVRTPRNRLHVGSLVALLEECQGARARTSGWQVLAEKYGMDVERVERLVRVVNVPSVREDGAVMFVRDAESGADVVVTEVSFLYFYFFLGLTLDHFVQVEWKEPSSVADT